jgi:hypothetical protein
MKSLDELPTSPPTTRRIVIFIYYILMFFPLPQDLSEVAIVPCLHYPLHMHASYKKNEYVISVWNA